MNSSSSISVVIPVFNDGKEVLHLLDQLLGLPHIAEIRVVDAGNDSGLFRETRRRGILYQRSPKGRGFQMNRGGMASKGNILWFLHADNRVAGRATGEIVRCIDRFGVVGGAFTFRLSEARWYGPLFHAGIGFRSKILRLPFGDQGLFVRADVFRKMEGFRVWPILEDADFVCRLRREGRLVVLRCPIGVSPRRWDAEGVFRRTVKNWLILAGYRLGIPPDVLAELYPPFEV